jgi:hypothetical protein
MNEKLTPDFVARIAADITAATETEDCRYLLARVAFRRMGPLFAAAGLSPRTAIGREIAASLLATVEVAAEAGIHAYLAHREGVLLEDLLGAVMPADEDDEDAEHTPADDLADAIAAALEVFLGTLAGGDDEGDEDGYPFADDFERDAYREVKAEFKALDHSGCGLGHCTHAADPVPEIERRAAERRARAARPEPEVTASEEPALAATEPPRTPEQQDRRYPGLPRGSDD